MFTIGFTQTSARSFFKKIRANDVKIVLDTRIHRDGQLSGFAKAGDLDYFLEALTSAKYRALASLAPTPELLKAYREKKLTWPEYAGEYDRLLHERRPERLYPLELFSQACLLCSEHDAKKCHRRLAAEYLQKAFAFQFEIIHL